MAADLIPAAGPEGSLLLRLPAPETASDLMQEVRYALNEPPPAAAVTLECGGWQLTVADLQALRDLLEPRALRLERVIGLHRQTLVAAAALGLETRRLQQSSTADLEKRPVAGEGGGPGEALTIHRGTLRSGDHLHCRGSVLLLGDVNPGARISAAGHVLIWGRLRGIAHAGRDGWRQARIVALQLRPLQLRIAEAVARGPQDLPPDGLAEQARLIGGEIGIEPAPPGWPLRELSG
ncbi:MAG: septum site-determining protein MinC [Synechococcaceae cyanobacterium]|nr:septum site-determining protein MinC [Synechococcaceae cyanobacterium]